MGRIKLERSGLHRHVKPVEVGLVGDRHGVILPFPDMAKTLSSRQPLHDGHLKGCGASAAEPKRGTTVLKLRRENPVARENPWTPQVLFGGRRSELILVEGEAPAVHCRDFLLPAPSPHP
jgi:hypothetical protein